MEGLKYILREIEARRTLLHDFVRGIETSKEFTLFDGGIPDFVRDGELIYRPTSESEPLHDLTVEGFNASHKRQFRNLRQWSCLSIPLKPGEPITINYEINEVLAYELGGGHCIAHILMQLWTPSLDHPDRWFHVFVEHRYIPGQRYPQKQEIDVNAVRRLLGKDVPDYPEYKDYEVITPSVYRYKWWKEDARKARSRLNPVDNKADIGGGVYWIEDNKVFTAPIIVIDEKTTSEQIWKQLLIYAWGSGYFNSLEETKAYEELRRYFKPEVRNKLIEYFLKHTFSPYDAKSNLAYLGRLSRLWKKEYASEGRKRSSKKIADIGLPDNTGDDNTKRYEIQYPSPEEPEEGDYSIDYFSYPPGSIPDVVRQTGVHEWTIYRLIKQGGIKATRNEEGFISLDGNAIDEIRQLASRKERRKAIKELAKLKGKSDEAIKKWLQRHKHLPEDKSNEELKRWLLT